VSSALCVFVLAPEDDASLFFTVTSSIGKVETQLESISPGSSTMRILVSVSFNTEDTSCAEAASVETGDTYLVRDEPRVLDRLAAAVDDDISELLSLDLDLDVDDDGGDE
jgi:hypothetical protein